MDAFESLVGHLLSSDKYWVKHSVKVNLTKKDKEVIGKPTMPRPEIDIVAFDFKDNILYLIEVKSFLDSGGVDYTAVTKWNETNKPLGQYKILTSKLYQDVIIASIRKDWETKGYINEETDILFGLVAGKINKETKDQEIEKCFQVDFESKKWLFWGPKKLTEKLVVLSETGYENHPITIASKLIIRNLDKILK